MAAKPPIPKLARYEMFAAIAIGCVMGAYLFNQPLREATARRQFQKEQERLAEARAPAANATTASDLARVPEERRGRESDDGGGRGSADAARAAER